MNKCIYFSVQKNRAFSCLFGFVDVLSIKPDWKMMDAAEQLRCRKP